MEVRNHRDNELIFAEVVLFIVFLCVLDALGVLPEHVHDQICLIVDTHRVDGHGVAQIQNDESILIAGNIHDMIQGHS